MPLGKQNKSKCQEDGNYHFPTKKFTNNKTSQLQNRQKINTCINVKSLGVTEENPDWNLHFNSLKLKLNQVIGLLCKIGLYVPKFLLKTLYYTIFHSSLICACQIWGHSFNTFNQIQASEDKTVRIIIFRANNYN